MKTKYFSLLVILSLVVPFISCNTSSKNHVNEIDETTNSIQKDLLNGLEPVYSDGEINAVIEIPAGTIEKWEMDKSDGEIKLQYVNENPRLIKYLGYPANYGMIPRTLLSKNVGGDGDPLDVIVLGPPIERGSVVKCKLIGVMYLIDNGEKDDKLIAVAHDYSLYDLNSIEELNQQFNGITDILQLWFTNYKGINILTSKGFGEKKVALDMLNLAINEYNQLN